ncbi:hypothetical protein GF345_06540 [Candidatus Woesearchaeota archaeon]|nr:hypothetical protein [Candidatus Woesearchaeota archaeon]
MKKHKKSRKRSEKQFSGPEKPKGLTKTAWMGIFIAAIMILSVVGFMWNGNTAPDLDYNGHSFTLTQDRMFMMEHEGQNIVFYNHPSEVEHISIGGAGDVLSDTRMMYSTLDPQDEYSEVIGATQYDIKKVLDSEGTLFAYAFTEENEYNKTIITCSNATASVPVLYFRKSNLTNVSFDDGCIIAEAESEYGMIMLRDRLLYAITGVIE